MLTPSTAAKTPEGKRTGNIEGTKAATQQGQDQVRTSDPPRHQMQVLFYELIHYFILRLT